MTQDELKKELKALDEQENKKLNGTTHNIADRLADRRTQFRQLYPDADLSLRTAVSLEDLTYYLKHQSFRKKHFRLEDRLPENPKNFQIRFHTRPDCYLCGLNTAEFIFLYRDLRTFLPETFYEMIYFNEDNWPEKFLAYPLCNLRLYLFKTFGVKDPEADRIHAGFEAERKRIKDGSADCPVTDGPIPTPVITLQDSALDAVGDMTVSDIEAMSAEPSEASDDAPDTLKAAEAATEEED